MIDQSDTRKIPYFSVIVPVYGVESFLEQCVESILAQDFFDYELILVDDGSPDRCPEICDAYAREYSQIRVVHKHNGGLSSARNAGTEAAEGKYIWWVDADDWIADGALSALHHACQGNDPDMVKFNHYRFRKEPKEVCSNAHPGAYHGESEIRTLLDQAFYTPGEYCLSACCHLYKREFLREHQFCFVSEREVGSEDYLFNLQTLVCARRFHVIDTPLYFYRLRVGSLTQRYRTNLLEQYTNLYRQLKHYYHQRQLYDIDGRICRFYVWHLIHGTCVGNEYRVTTEHTMEEGRKRLSLFLRSADFCHAARHCDCTGLSLKQRIQVAGMALGAESLLYWLYVVKPKQRKGDTHES